MALRIQRAAVLGAGVMGAQIAAFLAAAGVRTHLLDLASDAPPEDKKLRQALGKNFRSARAVMAMEQMRAMRPSPLTTPDVLQHIIPGNFDDDMAVLADVDWVIEAVVERPEVKKSIHQRIAEVVRPHVPITTNTSGISVSSMAENFPEHLAQNFFGTHFFNPPRYLHLVEIICHENSKRELVTELSNWISERLGKGIVPANDTSNFIANRIGVFNLQSTIKHMGELGLNIETVDALTGKLMGRPASATFRTLDVVGIDTYVQITSNAYQAGDKDAAREIFTPASWLKKLVANGACGAKSNSTGCYKKAKVGGNTEILAYRPEQDEYVSQAPQSFPWQKAASKTPDTIARLKSIINESDAGAQLVWRSLRDTMAYAANNALEIANGDLQAIDNGVRWGFNWQWGPFEIWQGLGVKEVRQRMLEEGLSLPDWLDDNTKFYSPTPASKEWFLSGASYTFDAKAKSNRAIESAPHELHLPRFANKDDNRVVLSNESASLVDIGDGVACLSFHSKMNAIDPHIVELLHKTVSEVNKNFNGLVIGNDGEQFSAGANLAVIYQLIEKKDFAGVEDTLKNFQAAMQLIKYASFPSAAAIHGLTLGGGCEVAMHTTMQVVAGETYAGLVEAGVGLIPAGGGSKELCVRAHQAVNNHDRPDPMPFIQAYFKLVAMAQVSTSGQELQASRLMPNTAVSLSKEHTNLRAKSAVLHAYQMGYIPPSPEERLKVVGDPGIQTINLMLYNMLGGGFISEHDRTIAEAVASILCGGPVDGGSEVSEGYLLELERQHFVELCRHEKTKARIEHMLKTGKPLRN